MPHALTMSVAINTADNTFSTEALQREIQSLRTQVAVLTEQLASLKKKFFGRSSEKQVDILTQTFFDLFDSIAPEQTKTPVEVITVPAHTRKRGGRKKLSDALPRVERRLELSDEEKLCKTCGTMMEVIGEDISERGEITPPKIFVEKIIRPRCVCRACNSAPVAKQLPYVLPHSIAGNSMFAYAVTAKFCDAIPFYRLEGILSRYGVHYPQANMSNNVMQFHEKYGEKIVTLLEKQITQGSILHIDETTMQVMREENRKNTTKSYAWTFSGGNAVLFTYRPTREAKFIYDILEKYRGAVMTDGYSAYDSVFATLQLSHAACHAHVRRYFVEALEAGKDERAKIAIEFYTELYGIEKIAREKNYEGDALIAFRQEHSKPILNKFREWLYELRPKIHNSKGLLATAVNYTVKQWPKLVLYLGNPAIPIDNNAAENKIRPFVIGRKNWLLAGSPRGAEAACMFYSLVETAKVNGHDPFAYLVNLFKALPYAENDADIERLMPYNQRP